MKLGQALKKTATATALGASLATATPNTALDTGTLLSRSNASPTTNASKAPILVNFNGDIHVSTIDGQIANPQDLQVQIQQMVQQALAQAHNKDRDFNDEEL